MTDSEEMLFEWDEWKARAVAQGVPEDLAELGRRIMRDAYMQRWPEDVLSDCGWDDDGFGMLALACAKPAETRRDWERLYARHHRRPACPVEAALRRSDKAIVSAPAPLLIRHSKQEAQAHRP
ncbi:hypothetical protein [Acidithiobacillus sp.]|jgi:hypothetical protein|uniref:hypothetical protein n=1 Tax=Acidithiobacillus sp. TaxID=1872118 RepID=UPI002635C9F9|nr:hypothetical protein [Acidithiobacillus sp.]